MSAELQDVFIFRNAWLVHRFSGARGVMIVRPQYVAMFLTEPIKHAGNEVGKLVAKQITGSITFEKTHERNSHVFDWAESLSRLRPRAFDERVLQVAKQDGITWHPTDAQVRYWRPLLRRKRGLWFVSGKRSIRAPRLLTPGMLAKAQRMLASWSNA